MRFIGQIWHDSLFSALFCRCNSPPAFRGKSTDLWFFTGSTLSLLDRSYPLPSCHSCRPSSPFALFEIYCAHLSRRETTKSDRKIHDFDNRFWSEFLKNEQPQSSWKKRIYLNINFNFFNIKLSKFQFRPKNMIFLRQIVKIKFVCPKKERRQIFFQIILKFSRCKIAWLNY